jgi:hypothetical protein
VVSSPALFRQPFLTLLKSAPAVTFAKESQ